MNKHNKTESQTQRTNCMVFSGGCQRGGGEGRRAIHDGD